MPDVDSPRPMPNREHRKVSWVLTASYISDWICLIAAGVVGVILGDVTPNKRPFSLEDPNISFPFTEHETVTSATLLICNAGIPVAVILIVTLIFVPGPTVPKGTPKSLIWKRKLWELHVGWLGLALSLMGAWFITQGMKNMFGKPRPDLLSRCQPDIDNLEKYIVGGYAGKVSDGRLVSAEICKNTDSSLLDDGFRSYPSGHSSSAAAGLIYLSLFLASKFSVVIPFLPPTGYLSESSTLSSFPSRANNGDGAYNNANDELSAPSDPMVAKQIASHSIAILAARKQAAAPPVYLLVITVLPFFTAIFIAGSRWFDFRHHGFDILFGFLIGTITAFFAFRYYHLPISRGAGWAWAPRSPDKAFWAGIGSYSYATDKKHWIRPGDEEEGRMSVHQPSDIELSVRHRMTPPVHTQSSNMNMNTAYKPRDNDQAVSHDNRI